MNEDLPRLRKERGERMRAAAKAAGLRSRQVAEALEVTEGAVRGWWNGFYEPNLEKFIRYVELTGANARTILFGEDSETDADGEGERLTTWLIRWLKRVNTGEDPAVALEAIAHGLGVDKGLTEAERAELLGAGEALRATAMAQQVNAFGDLTEDQRSVVLRVIDLLSAGNRGS